MTAEMDQATRYIQERDQLREAVSVAYDALEPWAAIEASDPVPDWKDIERNRDRAREARKFLERVTT